MPTPIHEARHKNEARMRELIASEKYLLVTFLFRSGFAERFWRRVNRAAGRRWKREKMRIRSRPGWCGL